MKDRLNIPLTTAITIATILLSVGGSYALLKAKSEEIDKVKVKAEDTEKKMIKVEVQLQGIDESLKEQKVVSKEMKDDLKQVIKLLMEKQ